MATDTEMNKNNTKKQKGILKEKQGVCKDARLVNKKVTETPLVEFRSKRGVCTYHAFKCGK